MTEIQDLIYARRVVENGAAQGLREAAGLTRGEMARACGVTTGAIRLWERRERQPQGAPAVVYGRLLRSLAVR